MTGFGEARSQMDGLAVAVEVRTINSRHFKLSFRASEGYAALEPEIEAATREIIRRGTVQLNLRVDREASAEDYRINTAVVENYRRQLEQYTGRSEWNDPNDLRMLLSLPGAVDETSSGNHDPHGDWPLIEPVVAAALGATAKMRAEEGVALAADLAHNGRQILELLDAITRRSPDVTQSYQSRLKQRVEQALSDLNVTVEPADLLREVSLFADRSDISEEIVRLRSHLQQYEAALMLPGKLRPQAGIHRPGNGPRNQYDRLQSKRRGDFAACRGDQNRAGADTGADSERRVEVDEDVECGDAECAMSYPRPYIPHPHPLRRPVTDTTAKLIVLSGPSGVGKSTVLRRLLERHPDWLRLSVSATTRPPRPDEVDGVDYYFLSPEEFARRHQAGEFLECCEVFGRGHWYGTLKSEVTSGPSGQKWVILDIDVEGAEKVRGQFPDVPTIFLRPSSEAELERRLRAPRHRGGGGHPAAARSRPPRTGPRRSVPISSHQRHRRPGRRTDQRDPRTAWHRDINQPASCIASTLTPTSKSGNVKHD